MGNLALHSAEESDNLRATTGTVEVPTKEPDLINSTSPRHVTMEPNERPRQISTERPSVYALHMAQSLVHHAERLPRYPAVQTYSFPRFPKEPLVSRRNCSEQSRNSQA